MESLADARIPPGTALPGARSKADAQGSVILRAAMARPLDARCSDSSVFSGAAPLRSPRPMLAIHEVPNLDRALHHR
jgi:hypothetical protein